MENNMALRRWVRWPSFRHKKYVPPTTILLQANCTHSDLLLFVCGTASQNILAPLPLVKADEEEHGDDTHRAHSSIFLLQCGIALPFHLVFSERVSWFPDVRSDTLPTIFAPSSGCIILFFFVSISFNSGGENVFNFMSIITRLWVTFPSCV